MANMNLTVNMENLTEEERKQFLALVKKATGKESKAWKPKDNKTYYYMASDGDTSDAYWNNNSKIDNDRYAIGNCFPTKEKAKFAVERLKVIAELKRFAQENNEKEIDWRDYRQCKYFIYCEFHDNAEYIDIGCVKECKNNDIYFTSEEIAQQAIYTIGEDRIKKYYLEVED